MTSVFAPAHEVTPEEYRRVTELWATKNRRWLALAGTAAAAAAMLLLADD